MVVSICLTSVLQGAGKGVIIYTDGRKNSDGDALVSEYSSVWRLSDGVEFTVATGHRYKVSNFRFKTAIAYPTRTSISRNGVETERKRLADALERFPQASRFVFPYIKKIDFALKAKREAEASDAAAKPSVVVTTSDGKKYRGCKISKVEEGGKVVLSHEGGVAGVLIEELSTSTRERLTEDSREWHLLEPGWGPMLDGNSSKFLLLESGVKLLNPKYLGLEDEMLILEHSEGKTRLALSEAPQIPDDYAFADTVTKALAKLEDAKLAGSQKDQRGNSSGDEEPPSNPPATGKDETAEVEEPEGGEEVDICGPGFDDPGVYDALSGDGDEPLSEEQMIIEAIAVQGRLINRWRNEIVRIERERDDCLPILETDSPEERNWKRLIVSGSVAALHLAKEDIAKAQQKRAELQEELESLRLEDTGK